MATHVLVVFFYNWLNNEARIFNDTITIWFGPERLTSANCFASYPYSHTSL